MGKFKHCHYRQPLFSLLLLPLVLSFGGIPQIKNIDFSHESDSKQIIVQNTLIKSIISFWKRKPRRKSLGSRGGMCPVSPGLIDTYFIWSDRPLFLWYSPNKKENTPAQLILREEETEKVVWTQSVNLTDQKVFYSGEKSLEPGKRYQWQLLEPDKSNITLPSTFEIMAASDRNQIQADLHALEQKLKRNKASEEEIALQKADYFANYKITHKTEDGIFHLWSDSFESLYKVDQPSPSFVAKRQASIEDLCN
ncbi:hypothetical protein [uncultured Nostoc sp.]|uniref:hypothetical protein n=1 Tax=uncultured Nostoc sp. TaxID=340711 RepID=UPI0035CB55F8